MSESEQCRATGCTRRGYDSKRGLCLKCYQDPTIREKFGRPLKRRAPGTKTHTAPQAPLPPASPPIAAAPPSQAVPSRADPCVAATHTGDQIIHVLIPRDAWTGDLGLHLLAAGARLA